MRTPEDRMICRIWHGRTTPDNADAYETLLRSDIFRGIRSRGIPGLRAIELLRRDAHDGSEFVTLMWFDELENVRAFAGPDYETAVIPPPARALLSQFDARSAHYRVLEGGPDDATGEVARLSGEVQRAFDHGPWHGSSVADILADVDASLATQRPVDGAHTIWEIVLHMTGWVREVVRRLGGAPPGVPPEGDWPPVGPASADAWQRTRADLAAAHEELLAALARFSPAHLYDTIQAPGAAPQDAVTFYQTVHGLVQHDAYHAGQIALLKRANTPAAR
jgi:uncharacterized damage-inducible protein DinB